MTILSVPLYPQGIGGEPICEYVERVQALGVRGGELQLPSTWTGADLPWWRSFVDGVRALRVELALRVLVPLGEPAWMDLLPWINSLAATSPLVVLVQGASGARPQAALVNTTVSHLRMLCDQVNPSVTIALESGWNRGAANSPLARFHDWQQRRRSQRLARQRPSGVGSGLGAGAAAAQSAVPAPDPLDPPAEDPRGAWSATGTRAATLAIVEQLDRTNCMIAWDLASDWLGSYWHTKDQPALPSATFLQRVGYVRVHDALPNGTTHLPLVVGNVPYASYLRALHGAGFNGWACVVMHYTQQAQIYGARWHLLERSITATRSGLRLPHA